MPSERIELVVIGRDGAAGKDFGTLSEAAAEACRQTVSHYERAGFSPPWISFLAREQLRWVGVCAFVSAPSAGRVEIAYHTFSGFEGRGVATAMARELITRARDADSAVAVVAKTLPESNASNAILRKLGFTLRGELDEPGQGMIWEWVLTQSSDH